MRFVQIYSKFFKESIEMPAWDFTECKVCNENSTKDWKFRINPETDPEAFENHKFKLCPKCEEELTELSK